MTLSKGTAFCTTGIGFLVVVNSFRLLTYSFDALKMVEDCMIVVASNVVDLFEGSSKTSCSTSSITLTPRNGLNVVDDDLIAVGVDVDD